MANIKEMENIELWSMQKRMVYQMQNATFNKINGVVILCTTEGEPLVLRKR